MCFILRVPLNTTIYSPRSERPACCRVTHMGDSLLAFLSSFISTQSTSLYIRDLRIQSMAWTILLHFFI